jgi:hypothetical protein
MGHEHCTDNSHLIKRLSDIERILKSPDIHDPMTYPAHAIVDHLYDAKVLSHEERMNILAILRDRPPKPFAPHT